MLVAVEFTLQNISENDGYAITLTGMAIVFFVLTLISVTISLLPRILDALAPYLPAEIEHHHHAPAASTPTASGETDPAVVVAIAAVLHSEMRSRAGQS